MPTLLLIEALAQISVILTFKTFRIEPTGQELMFFAGIDDGRFKGEVRPGDVLYLRSEIVRLRKKMGWFKAIAQVEGKCVAEMTMLAAIQAELGSVSLAARSDLCADYPSNVINGLRRGIRYP